MVVVTVMLGLAFFTLHKNQRKYFDEINARYENQEIVNLGGDFDPQLLAKLLVEGDYITDAASAKFIADHIKNTRGGNANVEPSNPTTTGDNKKKVALPNLGALNKRDFFIPVTEIDKTEYPYLKSRVDAGRENMTLLENAEDINDLRLGDGEITVIAQKNDETKGLAGWIKRNILRKKTVPVANVPVYIRRHDYDDSSNPVDEILGRQMTDEKGVAVFKGLDKEGYYSVIVPVRRESEDGKLKEFEYGDPKGTTRGNLGSMKARERKVVFTQREHALPPFDASTYRALKADNVIIARIPKDFDEKLTSNLIYILLAWWALHIFLCLQKKKSFDQSLLPLMMALSGICLLIMYAIHNPLTDTMLGNDMAGGILSGIAIIAMLSWIDIVTFFNGNYRFLGSVGGRRPIHFDIVRLPIIWISGIFGKRLKNFVSKLPEGGGYLIFALVITALLIPFGSGPEGSGVKVNLFFFQPGEMAKYLIVIFLAAFFYNNEDKIRKFSGKFEKYSLKIQFRTIIWLMLGIGALLLLYLGLGDMGPALVITIAFIIIYSVIRNDIAQLVFGVVSFSAFLWAGSYFNGLVSAARAAQPGADDSYFKIVSLGSFALVWLALWLLYGFTRRKKQFYESAIFLNLVIAAFIAGGPVLKTLGAENAAARLNGRIEISENIWKNDARGGDHVAQGVWSLASGGIVGQGLGRGNPNLVPAFHTDMVFMSIGEEIGWFGLLAVILCMAMLIVRAGFAGRRCGHPLAFYLAVGIVVITGVQFFIITAGSTGIIPLTGVAVPFLSYGKVGMIMNLAAFGAVLSISGNRAGEHQKEWIKKYDFMLNVCKYGYAGFALFLAGVLFKYQFLTQDSTLVRPALVVNTRGERIVEYNPRIQLLMRNLYAGNIYDRNGILLATSNKNEITDNSAQYKESGVDETIYKNELSKRKRRYYPFGENLIFWLGDSNRTDVLWNINEDDPRGYIAEHRHLSDLRGFNNLKYDENNGIETLDWVSDKFKASQFHEAVERNVKYPTDYDYSFLIPYLKAGIDSREVELFNDESSRKKRDITLTVDAELQTKMQNEIIRYISNPSLYINKHKDYFKTAPWRKLRISVVALNAETGELLCSANYPLPDMKKLKEFQKIYAYSDSRRERYTDRDLGLTYQTAPGSTAKLMSALAGLKKMGKAAAEIIYNIDSREAVEPPNKEPLGRITMRDAIVRSSNNYFINLVNDRELYPSLNEIYQAVGIRVDRKSDNKALTPYFFTPDSNQKKKDEYEREIISTGDNNIKTYRDYISKRNKYKIYEKMSGFHNGHDWNGPAWAWGQGSMRATPLNMARIAAIVANGGNLAETQFLKNDNNPSKKEQKSTSIVSMEEADILKGYMQGESAKHRRSKNGATFPDHMGGKTGTPERGISYFIPVIDKKTGEPVIDKKTGKPKLKSVAADIDVKKGDGKMNDGWYVFFINSSREKAPLAVAVRMERLGEGVSGNAVRLTDKVVLKVLRDTGYLD